MKNREHLNPEGFYKEPTGDRKKKTVYSLNTRPKEKLSPKEIQERIQEEIDGRR